MEEHRLFIRYKIPGEVLIQPKDGINKTIKANLIDLCFKGAGVYSNELIPTDTHVRILITSKAFEGHIRGEGKIRYVRILKKDQDELYRMGIEFVDVDSDLIRDILTQLQEELSKKVEKNY